MSTSTIQHRIRHVFPGTFLIAGILIAGILAAAATGRSEEPKSGDLLKRPDATARAGTAAGPDVPLAACGDGDAATAVELAAGTTGDVDLLVSWGDAIVGIERVVIGLDPSRPDSHPDELEILVSADATGDHFAAVKSVALFDGAGPYQFDFAPATARRAIIRLQPPAGGSGVRITELSLFGKEGAATPRYGFKESPAKSLEVIAALEGMPIDRAMPADEEAMLEDGADGTFDRIGFAEAALIASGVTDEATRKAELAAIDRLVAAATASLAASGDLAAKGEALLRFLHAGPMKGGYEGGQTDVSKIIETGRFNCVSSAALYNIVGRRLGLDLRGIEVPEHAFSILYDGRRHMDVETTIPEGFNPGRSPEAVKRFARQTGFVYVPESHRDERREVNDAGLVAIIYFNHGVALGRQEKYPQSLAMYFRGLRLDPASASLVKNTIAALTNWSKSLLDAGKAAEAAAVSKAAVALVPDDSGIRSNATAAFVAWAKAEADAGRIAEGVRVLDDGLAILPHDGNLADGKVWLYTRAASKHVEHREWQAALDAAGPGLERLAGRDREKLAEWCGRVRSRWAKQEFDAGRLAAARDVLLKGLATAPRDSTLRDNLLFMLQETLAAAKEPDAEAAALATAVSLKDACSTYEVSNVVARHLHQRLAALQKESRWADAEAYAARHAAAVAPLGDLGLNAELWERVYGPWAEDAGDDWDAAIERLLRGLKAAPQSTRISGNLEYCLDKRARKSFETDWPAAVKAYESALELLPGSSLLENNLRYCRQQVKSTVEKKVP